MCSRALMLSVTICDRVLLKTLFNAGGSNSAVECQLPKLDVAGSIPVSRSMFSMIYRELKNQAFLQFLL